MPRRKRPQALVPPTEKVAAQMEPLPPPKRARRTATTPSERIRQVSQTARLTRKEREIALKAQACKKIALTVSLDEYEQLLDLAQTWGETFPTVVRGTLKHGLQRLQTAPNHPGNTSPFALGALNGAPPTPFEQMTGMRIPEHVVRTPPAFTPPSFRQGDPPLAQLHHPHTPRTVVTEHNEPVYQAEPPLPSGFTIQSPESAPLNAPEAPPMNFGPPMPEPNDASQEPT